MSRPIAIMHRRIRIGFRFDLRYSSPKTDFKEVCIDLIPKRSDEVCSTLPPREEEPLNSSYAAAEELGPGYSCFERDQEETAQRDTGRSAGGSEGGAEGYS